MTHMPPSQKVVLIDAYSLHVVPRPWPYAERHANDIAAHWHARSSANANFFNGPIHLLATWDIVGRRFTGELLRTDFASFLYWRDHDYRDASVRDCFGSALLWSADGKIILGRQSPGHVNSGLTYPPGGFIDQRDVGADSTIDLQASVLREASEELGFSAEDFVARQGAILTFDGAALSVAIELVSHLNAEQLLGAARRHIAQDVDAELEAVIAVTTTRELDGIAMPPFARHLLEHCLPRE